jgi:hypothetical protein
MLLFFTLLIITIIGIILCIIEERSMNLDVSWIGRIGVIMLVIGLVCGTFSGITSLTVHWEKDENLKDMLYEKEVLEFRLEHTDELSFSDPLYSDILAFNNKLELEKEYHDNIWIGSWFNSEIAEQVEYIDTESIDKVAMENEQPQEEQTSAKNFCTSCGDKIVPEDNFCGNCGKQLIAINE